jgi:membrane-associated phospholipid phosphatase
VAPWDRIGCNVLDAFRGENLALHMAALFSTTRLSAGGADHDARVFFEKQLGWKPFSDGASTIGYFAAPAVALTLYVGGLAAGDRKLTASGAAALQAVTVTVAATVVLKGLTGRPYPLHGGDPASPERFAHPEWAREWNGPSLGNSAWPSGHTAVAMSFASSMVAYYSDTPWLPFVVYPAASAIALGMLTGAHHWTSDVLAGAVLGHTIGWSAGRAFRKMHDARTLPHVQWSLTSGPAPLGVGIAGSF